MSETSTAELLRIAQVVPATDSEGPGRRFALWFQGCPLRCPGCCNPEFLPFKGGVVVPTHNIIEQLTRSHATSPLEGVSLLGGEPFAHAAGAKIVAEAAHNLDLGVMLYSGFTRDQLRDNPDADVQQLLSFTDLLVDGPYLRDCPEPTRRWVGSTNQGVHFLSDRYDPADSCWTKRNTLEIRVVGREVSVNGFPASGAASLWKGWTRKRQAAGGGA